MSRVNELMVNELIGMDSSLRWNDGAKGYHQNNNRGTYK